jgi:hypothetical protein
MPVSTTCLRRSKGKSWIPAFAGMTGWVSAESQSFGRLVL